jgi:hypothetical protein
VTSVTSWNVYRPLIGHTVGVEHSSRPPRRQRDNANGTTAADRQ